jgi:hypothetical protein
LVNLGAGFEQRLFDVGSLGLSLTAAHYSSYWGGKYNAQWSMALSDTLTAYIGTERTLGQYHDLASVTAIRGPAGSGFGQDLLSWRIDRAGLSLQLPFDRDTSFGLGYSGIEEGSTDQHLASLSFARSLGSGIRLSFSGYRDFGRGHDTGFRPLDSAATEGGTMATSRSPV